MPLKIIIGKSPRRPSSFIRSDQLVKTLLLFFLSLSVPLLAQYQLPTTAPEVPADQWETHNDAGVAVATLLIPQQKNGKTIYSLRIYIKNISNVNKGLIETGNDRVDLKVFYFDSNHIQQFLRPPDVFLDVVQKIMNITIPPGNIYTYPVNLTDNDLIFVTTHPIQCSYNIWDAAYNNHWQITTSPKQFYTQ
jgi:hypothetical protein